MFWNFVDFIWNQISEISRFSKYHPASLSSHGYYFQTLQHVSMLSAWLLLGITMNFLRWAEMDFSLANVLELIKRNNLVPHMLKYDFNFLSYTILKSDKETPNMQIITICISPLFKGLYLSNCISPIHETLCVAFFLAKYYVYFFSMSLVCHFFKYRWSKMANCAIFLCENISLIYA